MKIKKDKKKNLATELVCVIDRSGSMSQCLSDAQGGFDAFIASQKKLEGECHLTVNQFDTEFDTPIPRCEITEASAYKIVPRGMTALWDAVGRTIRQVEAEKPDGNVIILIVTDGQENSSHEFKADDVRKLIKEKEDAGWSFSFVGVGVDAYANGGQMGVAQHSTVSADSMGGAYASMNSAVSRSRTTGAKLAYSDEDRKKAGEKKKN